MYQSAEGFWCNCKSWSIGDLKPILNRNLQSEVLSLLDQLATTVPICTFCIQSAPITPTGAKIRNLGMKLASISLKSPFEIRLFTFLKDCKLLTLNGRITIPDEVFSIANLRYKL